jgi:hypothetical protein
MTHEKVNSLVIRDSFEKQKFFDRAAESVIIVPTQDWKKFTSKADIPDTIAWLSFVQADESGEVTGLFIGINAKKFEILKNDPSCVNQLINVVIRHEVSELYYSLQFESKADGLAHKLALVEEWKLAFELGCEEKYLHCVRLWAKDIEVEQGKDAAERFLTENESAYMDIAIAV